MSFNYRSVNVGIYEASSTCNQIKNVFLNPMKYRWWLICNSSALLQKNTGKQTNFEAIIMKQRRITTGMSKAQAYRI